MIANGYLRLDHAGVDPPFRMEEGNDPAALGR